MRRIRFDDRDQVRELARRGSHDIELLRPGVRSLLDDVRDRGDDAIVDYHQRFDGIELDVKQLRIGADELAASFAALPAQLRTALEKRDDHARWLHGQQGLTDTHIDRDGITAGEKVQPVDAAGLYVPGGTASFPTVMQILAVPAAIAGVPRVVACVPPTGASPAVLAAAHLSGVHEVYRIGGVAAIGALAYGTASVDPVNVIVGPGNAYVTAAKLEVFGQVGIDMPAGPSEAVIIAGPEADPRWVALDVLARAEHDPLAAVAVVTWDGELAARVQAEIDAALPTFPRRDIMTAALDRYCGFVLVRNREEAVTFTVDYAPEHLEILTDDAESYLSEIRNVGSVFLGHHTPVAVGDYLGVSGHVLPSSGYARTFSTVSTRTFQRTTQYERISPAALRSNLKDIMAPLAVEEGFDAHLASLEARSAGGPAANGPVDR